MIPILTNTYIRLGAVILFIILIVLGIVGAVLIKREFDIDWFVNDDDSQISDAMDVRDEYFGGRGYMFGMYTHEVNFASEST